MMNTITRFMFPEKSAIAFGLLRMLISVILLIQVYELAPSYIELIANKSLINSPLSAFLNYKLILILYMASLSLLLIGHYTKFVSFAVWLLHFFILDMFSSSNYGVDCYLHYTLFYFIFAPVGKWASFDHGFRLDRRDKNEKYGFIFRVMQIHFSLTYVAAGLGKLVGEQWRSGEALWRALMLPEYSFYNFSWLANYPNICLIFCWWTIIIEAAYPLFMFRRKTRTIWLLNIIFMHLGIIIFMKLYLFGITMIVLNLVLFLPSSLLLENKNWIFNYKNVQA